MIWMGEHSCICNYCSEVDPGSVVGHLWLVFVVRECGGHGSMFSCCSGPWLMQLATVCRALVVDSGSGIYRVSDIRLRL